MLTNGNKWNIIQTKVYKKDVIFMENAKDIAPINENLNIEKYNVENIKNLIYNIRGKQVILDSNVANLYEYSTKNINKAMKRNIERFPDDFCFQLTEEEFQHLRFHFGTLNVKTNNGEVTRKYLPYVYTEQGIAMLSGLLKNEIAVNVSINIMRAFVEMRRFLSNNGQLFERLTNVEYKLIEHDHKFDKVFDQLQYDTCIKQKVFFEGQIYDAFSMIIDLIRKAKEEVILIDNYIDIETLNILSKKNDNVDVKIYTKSNTKLNVRDINKFNMQYPKLEIKNTNEFHDRFLIIDQKYIYHIGASIKDAGKKCFGITLIKYDAIIKDILSKL